MTGGFRRGVRLGIDVGSVRIGVARCDPDGILAVPVTTVPRGPGDLFRIVTLSREHEAMEILVGHPVRMTGEVGIAAETAAVFAAQIAAAVTVPVRLVDERLSTVSAQRSLHSAGRDTRGSRSVIDQQAAAVIVQTAVDSEKATGRPPGTIVEVK